MSKTKIVCTLGPATESLTVLKKLINAGMNVARLNFSHGTHEEHKKKIANVRKASQQLKQPVAIMLDLQGPRIRIGDIGKQGRQLVKGHDVILTTAKTAKKDKRIPVTYQDLHKDIEAGQRILLVDGLIHLVVKKVEDQDIHCEVIIGGLVETHKGINLPDTKVSIPSLMEKDKKDVMFGVRNNVDFMALSFVRSAKDVYDLRYLIKEYEKKLKIKSDNPISIVVKIERREAIDNLDEIIEATDAVMVARGDLGIELPAEDVPLMQKMIIDHCLEKAKPVIVATQMLESMIKNPRPTRAEVSDVSNAVIDHADALMLSGETSIGQYPIETVEYMKKIIEKTESSTYDDLTVKLQAEKLMTTDEAISRISNILATSTQAKVILAASLSGQTGRLISRYRPQQTIMVACSDPRVQRQLILSWGVISFILPVCRTVEEFVDRSLGYLKKKKYVIKGDKIIIIAGEPVDFSGNINLVEVRNVDGQ